MRPILRFVLSTILTAASLSAQTAGGSVEGTVTAPDGSPVRKADVLLRASRTLGTGRQTPDNYLTRTDSSGHFSVSGVVPGAYECVPSRVGFEARPPDRFATTNYFPQITVAEGQHVAGVALKLTPLGVISGRIVDPEGFPVSHANVQALQYAYISGNKTLQQRHRAESDDRGEFRLYGLFPGEYYVRASSNRSAFAPFQAQGEQAPVFMETYYPGTGEAAQAKAVQVAAGGEVRSVDIFLMRRVVYSIRGRLPISPAGQLMTNINVRKRPADSSFRSLGIRFMGTGDGNYFEVPGLAPGTYVLTATQNSPAESLTARAVVTVLDRDVEGVELIPGAGLEISGVVKATGDAAVGLERLQVSLQSVEPGNGLGAPVKADGTFTIKNVAPDIYQVRVLPAAMVYATSMKLANAELKDSQLDLQNGGSATLTITVSGEMGRVDGSVVDDEGKPAPTVNVTLVPDQDRPDWVSRWRNMVADSQGRFNMQGLTPGHYTVFAWKDVQRGAPQDPAFRKPFEKLGVSITVEPRGRQTLSLKQIDPQNPPKQ